jgi:hypothetical protein
MSNDYEKLKQEEAEKSERLQELMYVVKSHKIKLNTSNSKLTNDIINTNLATPKKIISNSISDKRKVCAKSNSIKGGSKKTSSSSYSNWDNEKSIEHICDYYDELQYNYDYFNDKLNDNTAHNNDEDNSSCGDNKSLSNNNLNSINNNLNQFYQLTKLRKDILNRKLIDHRARLKFDKLRQQGAATFGDKSMVTSISSIVESLTIPTFHFHLILSLTMVLLTHQCPQYLLVL